MFKIKKEEKNLLSLNALDWPGEEAPGLHRHAVDHENTDSSRNQPCCNHRNFVCGSVFLCLIRLSLADREGK